MRTTSSETISALRLVRSDGVGPVTYHGLLARYGSAQAALDALPDLQFKGRRKRSFKTASVADIEDELYRLERAGGTLIDIKSSSYPQHLAEISDAPPFLTVLGDPRHLQQPAIGIVGARNASANGRKIAGSLARDLAAAGLTIWSGLARGIDTAAHATSVELSTVAVMAGGADVIYPRENTDLHARIIEQGCVISEMPVGTEPQAQYFPRRNRLISGGTMGVIIVEGTPKSGSLITARFALDQGRDVFAVPGSPLDPRARGPNNLIRDGAVLIRDANDVLDEVRVGLGLFADSEPAKTKAPQDTENIDDLDISSLQKEILSEVGTGSVTVDELRRQCQVSAPILAAALLELELEGQIERLPGNRIGALGS